MEVVTNLIKSALYECCSPAHCSIIINSRTFDIACQQAHDDLLALSDNDPSAHRDLHIIATGYSSYSAVLHYRLASNLILGAPILSRRLLDCYAILISQRGKLKSGAEIHYRAQIKDRFVLDHGYGTVIGETCRIGSRCYLLGGVVLGARGISGNPSVDRHPIIGNHVQIGAFSSVLGNISVGNDVFIGPGCTIISDLPDGCRVVNRDFETQQIQTRQPKDNYKLKLQISENKV